MGRYRWHWDRALTAPDVPATYAPPYVTGTAPLTVNTSNALRVSDAYACVRVLADSTSSPPLHAYRKTVTGRVPAGESARTGQRSPRRACRCAPCRSGSVIET